MNAVKLMIALLSDYMDNPLLILPCKMLPSGGKTEDQYDVALLSTATDTQKGVLYKSLTGST
jgi:hypothetical protein